MFHTSSSRSTGLFGFLFVASFLVWLVAIVDGPMFTASATVVGEYLRDGGGIIRIAGFTLFIGIVLFLFPFAAGVHQIIDDPENGWLGTWFMAALVFASVMMVLDVGLGVSIGLNSNASAELVESTWNLSKTINASFTHVTTGVWVAVASVGLLRAKAVPTWIGWLGIGLLAPQLITGSWLLTGEFTSLHDAAGGIGHLGAFLIWIPSVSWVILRKSRLAELEQVAV